MLQAALSGIVAQVPGISAENVAMQAPKHKQTDETNKVYVPQFGIQI